MTDFWEQVTPELTAPLNRKKVKPPPKGKYGEYVEAHHVISEANRIFGHGAWSYGVSELRLTNATVDDQKKHHVGYLALVTVEIGDVRKNDVGHGQGHGRSEGDAHDSAVKEAVTDGMKRALRTFGNTFGLALYDKTQADVADPEAEAKAAAQEDHDISMACADLEGATDVEGLKAIWAKCLHAWGDPENIPAEILRTKNTMKAQLLGEDRSAA
ncbi:MAG: Rad52/Rad22 family DNA repair protein [Pseudomonadota bacterium]